MNKGLSNNYLDSLMLNLPIHSYEGSFPCDQTPILSSLKQPSSLIINLDTSSLPGSHWVSIYHTKNLTLYFDSYGRNPNEELNKILKSGNKRVIYFNKRIQSFNSIFCGYFCVAFIISQEIGLSLNTFLNLFSHTEQIENTSPKTQSKLESNDKLVELFIIEFIKNC